MNLDRLHYMANQIAREFAAQGEAVAVAATADHLRLFWDPRMKTQIVAGDRSGLSPAAAGAVALLDKARP